MLSQNCGLLFDDIRKLSFQDRSDAGVERLALGEVLRGDGHVVNRLRITVRHLNRSDTMYGSCYRAHRPSTW